MTKFETWLKMQKKRDDPIGDLACDFLRTKEKTFYKSIQKFRIRNETVQDTVISAIDEFLNIYFYNGCNGRMLDIAKILICGYYELLPDLNIEDDRILEEDEIEDNEEKIYNFLR